MLATTLFTLSGLVSLSCAGYTLQDDYTSDFFSMFDFFTDDDPTNGYVNYVDQTTAQSSGLINTDNGAIYVGVDSTNVASGRGRNSVRLTSKASYNTGLVILDLAHMPGSICGTWPAFWMVGPSWPSSGEIDIIEGVNTQTGNSMTLHTGPGCSISTGSNLFAGSISTDNCDINAAGQSANAGCSIIESSSSSYGDGFNSNQGGVYATEWTDSIINIYFFPRGSVPSDISTSPDPSSWGTPTASFGSPTSCAVESFFKNQQIVFDMTFCGDWAGAVWGTDSTCSTKASTCQDYVQNNPSAFQDSYWSVNSLQVFTSDGQTSSNATATPTSAGWASQPTISIPNAISSAWPLPSDASIPISIPSISASVTGNPLPFTINNSPPATASSSATSNAISDPIVQSSIAASFSVPAFSAASPSAAAAQTSNGWANGNNWHHTNSWNGDAKAVATPTAAATLADATAAVSGTIALDSTAVAAADVAALTSIGAATATAAAATATISSSTAAIAVAAASAPGNDSSSGGDTDSPYAVVVDGNGALIETQEGNAVTTATTTTATTLMVQTKVAQVTATVGAAAEKRGVDVDVDVESLHVHVHRHMQLHKRGARMGMWRA